MKIGDLKSENSRVFKFKKGQLWDGDEEIFEYIEEMLLDYKDIGCPRVKQDTFFTIHCAKRIQEKN